MIILNEELNENSIDEFFEMSTLRKKRSGLPVNLYLDDSKRYKRAGHAKRIKFQPNKSDHPNTHEMIPMSIEDEPKILVQNVKIDLTLAELNKIKLFVSLNKDLLLDLSDMKIDFIEFGNKMKKV